ncbi:MAG: heavy metal translocating P-type ATPase [Epsilonproteobacteria bacterium]|nr:heavy metal translocating P-type ATPase [Campylobacterota bacterium]
MIKDEVDGEIKYFCCKGCQGIYHLLRSEGLDDFYEKVGSNKLEPPKNPDDDLHKFDLEGFKNKYITEKNGLYEINLIIEGIHCSACVWLNEKVLHQTEGIVEASINYTNNKAKIVWDPDTIKLSQIIEKIRSIGYNGYPYDPKLQEERANKARRDYYSRLLVAIFATMNIMWIAIAQYTGYFTGMRSDMKNVLNIAEFILATPTLFYTGWVYFRGAYFALKNRFINMDVLVITGATLAYIYSIYAMVTHTGEVYFDSVTMIITFVFVGKYLEVLSKKRAVDAMDSIMGSIPTELTVVKDGEKSIISIEEVEVGDIIEIKPGEKVVVDGVIVSGEGNFDLSSLTGESEPVYKKEGDEILSGSICLDSAIRYRATKDFKHSMLSSIVSLLEESISKKPSIEKLADKISGYFSLAILSIALLAFIGWYIHGVGFERALIIAISVIVIACPCALGLATPMAALIGINTASSKGILFKEAEFLETMAKSDTLLLDKTGTITEGKPKVVKAEFLKDFDKNILYSLVKSSNHPISEAIAKYLQELNDKSKEYILKDRKNIEARGIEARYEDSLIFGGNLELVKERGVKFDKDFDGSVFVFVIDSEAVAYFELKDALKKDAKEAISEIKKRGIKPVMLTGDNEKVAKEIAKEVGIEEVYHSLFPKDKADIVDRFHTQKKIVIMVGDGINDALALSRADIAISMGSGADVSVEVSDVVLLNDDMKSLLDAIKISKKAYSTIKENFALSIVYNSITIPLAVMGYVMPLVAALSMSLSSLIVVGNSFRIRKLK